MSSNGKIQDKLDKGIQKKITIPGNDKCVTPFKPRKSK